VAHTPLSLDPSSGYFLRNSERFIPMGVNYWPASCGMEVWENFPSAEIQHDLDVILKLGLNCVRFFLLWQDFEPQEGVYDETKFDHLRDVLTWCQERGIYAHPSLFVGWMSGGVFYPAWFRGRNMFSDAVLVKRSAAFARHAAEVIAPFHDSVLAIDQGNELDCLPESSSAHPSEVIHWCQVVNDAIREGYPQAIIISGNEQNQIMSDTGWRFGFQPGTDLYSMHGYPVPNWHPVSFDGMTDPFAQTLLPTETAVARAYGAVMVQEFGTIVTFGKRQQDGYLRAILPACWQAGANGFLWWCFRDVRLDRMPYTTCNFESTLGLVDAHDQVKPGLEYYLEFARLVPHLPSPAITTAATGIYLSSQYYLRDNQECPGHQPAQLARGLIMANYYYQRLGIPTRMVRGDLGGKALLDSHLKTIVIAGAHLRSDEAAALTEWVKAGGRLIWHGVDPVNYGTIYADLIGALPVDYRAPLPVEVDFAGEVWEFTKYARGMRVEVSPTTAQVLAQDAAGIPVMLSHVLGSGKVITTLPLVEDSIAPISFDRFARDRWIQFYKAEVNEASSG
jgi:hypothetical protein